MRRSNLLPASGYLWSKRPIVALNIWLLSQAFRYFEHLITVLTVAAILAFAELPVQFLRELASLGLRQSLSFCSSV